METFFTIALAIAAWEIGLALSRWLNRRTDAWLTRQAHALRMDQ